MKILAFLPAALVLTLGACDRGVPAPAATPSVSAIAEQPSVPEETKDPTGMLTIAPGAIDLCTAVDGAAAMEVRWDAAKANTDGIKIFLTDPSTGDVKLWLAAPPQGSDKTGNWMREGTVVRLLNANTDAELASLTVTSVACKR